MISNRVCITMVLLVIMLLSVFVSCSVNTEHNRTQNTDTSMITDSTMSNRSQIITNSSPSTEFMDSTNNSQENTISENEQSNMMPVPLQENSEQPDNSRLPSTENLELLTYEQYLKKIWVVSEWDGGAYEYPLSFVFTDIDIENGFITGKYSMYSVAYPVFYYYSFKESSGKDFTGSISDGVAECLLSDGSGNNGELTIYFRENNAIEVSMTFVDRNEDNVKLYQKMCEDLQIDSPYLPDGAYIYRPHNISDINKRAHSIRMNSFVTEIDSWGCINFVTVLFDNGRIWFSDAYITNENGDILYKFRGTISASEIIDVIIEDVNGDGLKDVKLILGFIDYSTGLVMEDMPQIEWLFLQLEGGCFYSSSLADLYG